MSERTPLLSGSVNGQSLPSRREVQNTVQNNIPSKAQRIQVAQAKGALTAGKLPYVSPLSSSCINADDQIPGSAIQATPARH